MIDMRKIQQDMPLLEHYIYLNTAAASAMPQPVVDAMTSYLQKQASIGPYLPSFRQETYAQVERIREKAALFIGAIKEEIAFMPNGSVAINYVAGGLQWKQGDEIIVLDTEMLSNYVPWLALQQQGVQLKVLKTNDEYMVDLYALEQLITPQTKLIAFAHMSNAAGALQPAKEICQLAQQHNVLTLMNANQTLGLTPMNVAELGCDFLVACGRKWLRGPEGSGILYVREALIPTLTPIMIGWGSTQWDYQNNAYSFLETAKRFEPGCPIIPSIFGLGAAIDYANNIGIHHIYDRVKQLTNYLIEQLATIPGIVLYGPQNSAHRLSITPFNIEGLSPDELTNALADQGVIIEAGTFMANTIMERNQITKMARFSPHYFNTFEEIDTAVSIMREIQAKAQDRH
ncbi:aminotransferase class V-fold PLP-dependent enzyme [Lysinibacillus boronitolerans]|uniref:Cysteine desulfurase n=1 Tax=Lysinibacillus boronitolerans JCM 21713 = 10a = NBRC 103108 TaxID=1294264 RepID=A0ABR4XZJ6_9BACI|nr:aminotransferase class V-fold PLP-dependent enzyme [Lysinibacillus boronitolerans]KGR85901.1 cysteine desulfurase [Lysinibacillus boronitolerans JCM 21713 = 10a = NBRC 103108]